MFVNEERACLIVMEGLDGAGTTTQARLLHNWLLKVTGSAHLTQEPSQGPAGAQIRAILTRRLRVDAKTLALLFAADRLDHLYCRRDGLADRLARQCHVICDRYYLSSLAYQSVGNDMDMHWIYRINDRCITPDLTVFLEVPVETCMQRILTTRGIHYELYESLEQQRRVSERYQAGADYLRKEGDSIHVVKGDLPVEMIHRYIRERVSPLLSPERLSQMEQRQLLSREWARSLLFFVEAVSEREGLFLLCVRTINNGYQALFVSTERERPIYANFFPGTGKIDPQAPVDLRPRLKDIAQEAQAKMYAGRLW